jgi:tetratricopeptide (TPR) repeat protein
MKHASKALLLVICLTQAGCSLGPSAASRSYKAYNAGEYEESLRLTNRALSTYEYSQEDKANLLFLKADNYVKLKQPANALGIVLYIIETYPNTEAYFRAKTLLASLKKLKIPTNKDKSDSSEGNIKSKKALLNT